MATIRQLENQVRELRRQLEESDQRLRNMRNEINRINSVQYEKLRREYDRLLEQKTRQNALEYEARLRQLQEEMAELNRKRAEAVRQALEQAQREQSSILNQLEEKNYELQATVERMQKTEREHTQVSASFSESMIRDAQEASKETSRVPHEFFFPHQFCIIQEHLNNASKLAGRQMFEAAAATADAARVEIELLRVKTDQKLSEWKELFDLYCEVVSRLHEGLESLLNTRLQTEAGLFSMDSGELDFWSQGLFTGLREQIMEAYRTVEEIEAVGINEYLKHQTPITLFRLNQTLNKAMEMETRLEAVACCVRSERTFSDARYMAGQRIIDLLEAHGYTYPVEAGFLKKNGEENPGDCYEILYVKGEVDELRISLIPVRRDGVCTGTRCLVRWTVRSVPDSVVVDLASEAIRDRLEGELGKQKIQIQIVSRVQDQRITTMVDDLRRLPDPNLLFERLRRS